MSEAEAADAAAGPPPVQDEQPGEEPTAQDAETQPEAAGDEKLAAAEGPEPTAEEGAEAADAVPGEEGQAEGDESAAPEQQPEEGEEEEKEEEEPIPTEPIDLSALPPIPLHYDVGENGKPIPAHGVESIFLTGTTLELVGLADMGSAKGLMTKRIEKEVILNDIQFRGAISDFHPIKAKVLEAGAEATHLLIRINETNLYGDNNNFELALSPDAAARWEYIDEETRRQERLRRLEARRVEYEKQLPRSKKPHRARPWVGFGSEVDIEEASVRPRRDGIRVTVERKRSDFNRELKLMDKDAQELWNSSQMECRPFKDPNYDLRRSELDRAVQACAPTSTSSSQTTGFLQRPATTQYAPLDYPPDKKAAQLRGAGMVAFLRSVLPRCELALVQNELTNVFRDELSLLGSEEGVSGGGKESQVTETQSFTHLVYSKNKVVTAIQWLPHRKGVIAVACTDNSSNSERIAKVGNPASGYILIWSFKDPIHPEYVLESPSEVFAFQANPANPEVIAAGCYNGQVVLWDTSLEHERIRKLRNDRREDGGDEAAIPVVRQKFQSSVEFSHHRSVSDLVWLPGVDVKLSGKLSKAGDGAKDCNFFATVAADGRINFWDMRIERLFKKGRSVDEAVWKPTHSVHLLGTLGLDLSTTRLCVNPAKLEDGGLVYLGSDDGEVACASVVRPDNVDTPDYMQSIIQPHAGPVVAIQRSPFFEDVLLSVGDWSFKVWKEGHSTPVFSSGYNGDYYTAGCWSPTRPAVVYLTDAAGRLEVWDLLDRSHEPSIQVAVTSTAIQSLSFNVTAAAPGGGGGNAAATAAANNQFLALGDSAGVLHVMELPRTLRRPLPKETKLMGAFLDRELARVGDVAARAPLREAARREAEEAARRAKEAAEAAARDTAAKDQTATAGAAGGGALGGTAAPVAPSSGAAAADKAAATEEARMEAEYSKIEYEFKVKIGLIKPKEEDERRR